MEINFYHDFPQEAYKELNIPLLFSSKKAFSAPIFLKITIFIELFLQVAQDTITGHS